MPMNGKTFHENLDLHMSIGMKIKSCEWKDERMFSTDINEVNPLTVPQVM